MIKEQYSFKEFEFSSQVIRDLVEEHTNVQPFVGRFFTIDNLQKQTARKKLSSEARKVLVERLILQNQTLEKSKLTEENIQSLSAQNTYTITTGHQLNLMTGPLYSIYKVAQVIGLTNHLNSIDSNNNYVPVFWMATEDHDFEEINHINLCGNKIAWDKSGQKDKIVGEITPEGIESFTNEIRDKYREDELKQVIDEFAIAYTKGDNLATATRMIMNSLFKDFGLVIIDGNDAELKKSFQPVAKKEIESSLVFEAAGKTNHALEAAGYHQQVYLRNCNLFYINSEGTRERIAKEDDGFYIGERKVEEAQLLAELSEFPVRFSPNALLRPVYQELILPNLAYIGGGGEIAYWMQLKGVFDDLALTFPLLRVRDSILLLKQRELQELSELGLSLKDLKRDIHDIIKEIALDEVEVMIELTHEQEHLYTVKNKVVEKANSINPGLIGMIEAEFVKMEKSIERIESKLIKAEKAKHEQKAKKIEKLQSKIYPNGGFQERFENFLPYYLSDRDFVGKIVKALKAEDQPKVRIIEN
ncbi:bacillithiol biosynthesis cysteine-adding enzyme BshC [Crocinitomix sp.]|nr:bacillithiol biosynthesis cysteine-adding enzyme BshC [Crocinitomix sp.]